MCVFPLVIELPGSRKREGTQTVVYYSCDLALENDILISEDNEVLNSPTERIVQINPNWLRKKRFPKGA